jgi:hypothetical protein
MNELLIFVAIAIALPLGILALFRLLTPRNAPLVIVVALVSLVSLIYLLTTFPMFAAVLVLIGFVAAVMFSRRIREKLEQRDRPEATVSNSSETLPPVFTEVRVRRPIQKVTVLSAEAQATTQPAPAPVEELLAAVPAPPPIPASPQPVPEAAAAWTDECDLAVGALVGLKIPKRKAIDLVRQSPGATVQEILGHALRIHGQSRGQVNGN